MGGMETYSKSLSEALGKHLGIETLVLPGHKDGSVPSAGELLGFGLRAALWFLLMRKRPAVTHVADMASWPLALAARLRCLGGRQVLSAHGTDVSYPLRGGLKGRLYGAYLCIGARLLGPVTVLANSSATAEAVRRYGYRDTEVIPLAAEISPINDAKPGQAMLFCGRLIPLKGCAWFVREVLPLLPETVTLDIAGTIWDEAEASVLDHPRVRFLGRLEQEDLWRACAGALCVVAPNIDVSSGAFEGFGLVALEAAAAGGVTLASRQGGLEDAVIDGETGFLLPPQSAQDWADKILEILEWSDEARAGFVARATEVCAERFSWDRVARDTLWAYRIPSQGEEL